MYVYKKYKYIKTDRSCLSPQKTEKQNMWPGRAGLAACLADSDRLSNTGPARNVDRNSRQMAAARQNVSVLVTCTGGLEAGERGLEARYL